MAERGTYYINWHSFKDEYVPRLQNHLKRIRKVLGLNAEALGDLVGLSRQQINNIEGHRIDLKKSTYLALMIAIEEYCTTFGRYDVRDILCNTVYNNNESYSYVFDEITGFVHVYVNGQHYIAHRIDEHTILERTILIEV